MTSSVENAPRTLELRRILVAVDLDESSEQALEVGAELAQRFGAELTLVHVWDVPPYPYTSMAASIVRRAVEEAARNAFDALLDAARSKSPNVKGVLKHGTAWREIFDTVQQLGADLLILGTHGRRGLPRALLGSVAEKVVRMSRIPVLTIPARFRDDSRKEM